jgi:hypothetical protein
MRPEERHGAARRAEIGCGRLKHSTVQRAFELASDQLAQRVLTASVGALRSNAPNRRSMPTRQAQAYRGRSRPFGLRPHLAGDFVAERSVDITKSGPRGYKHLP